MTNLSAPLPQPATGNAETRSGSGINEDSFRSGAIGLAVQADLTNLQADVIEAEIGILETAGLARMQVLQAQLEEAIAHQAAPAASVDHPLQT